MSDQNHRSSTSSPPLRALRKEVFPEELYKSSNLQQTTVFWIPGLLFHAHAHCCWMVDGKFEVVECKMTHVSSPSTAPPHATYWRHITSSKGSTTPPVELRPSAVSPLPRRAEAVGAHSHIIQTTFPHTSASASAPKYHSDATPVVTLPCHFVRGRAHALRRPESAQSAYSSTAPGAQSRPVQIVPSAHPRAQFEHPISSMNMLSGAACQPSDEARRKIGVYIPQAAGLTETYISPNDPLITALSGSMSLTYIE